MRTIMAALESPEKVSLGKIILSWLQKLWEWRRILEQRFGRFSFIFPLLSLVWGIISAFFLARDYAHSQYLAISLGALTFFSIFLKLWFHGLGHRWEASWFQRLASSQKLGAHNFLRWLMSYVAKQETVESMALLVNQTCIQYMTMFCIPLLYAAESWGTLGMTMIVGATSLWDRWWERLAKRPWYMAIVRGCGALLAISYAFPVLFPEAFSYFYPVMATATFIAVLPWSCFFPYRTPTIQEASIVGIVVGAIMIQFFLGEWIRVPVLSVWVHRPALGLEVSEARLGERWPRKISSVRLEKALENKIQICCLTPVVSPSGMMATIAHEWLIDGQRIDYVPLGRIRSTDKTEVSPYRTYSCKQNFPRSRGISRIECRVYLDDTVDIGGASVSVRP
jgi:hypothetical protein